MPSAEEYDLAQVKNYSPQELELLSKEKSSGISNMLSEAYEWGKENKVAVGIAVGTVALAALSARGVSRARSNMAEMYGPPAEQLSTRSSIAIGDLSAMNAERIASARELKFVAHDDALFGGRIGVEAKAAQAAGDASGRHALNARLHHIPTFTEMPWDPITNRLSAGLERLRMGVTEVRPLPADVVRARLSAIEPVGANAVKGSQIHWQLSDHLGLSGRLRLD